MAQRGQASGWTVFAAVMLFVGGVLNVFNGLFAIMKDEYLADQLLVLNLSAWGWLFIIFGALQMIAGITVMSGGGGGNGRALGIILAVIAICFWFLFIFAFPTGALIGIIVNVLIAYGLTVGQDRA